MEQQEHITTLCAAGTIGVAVAGLAIGIQEDSTYTVTPGKRKWPGASSTKSPVVPQTPFDPRRTVSQPATSRATTQKEMPVSLPTSLLRKSTLHETRPLSAYQSAVSESRGSSTSRGAAFRPRTADTRSTSERRERSTGSSWLKRISTVSLRSSSPAASARFPDSSQISSSDRQTNSNQYAMPNKLVKRSTSQRAISHDQARGSFLRRPATSHQRTVTLKEWDPRQHIDPTTAISATEDSFAEQASSTLIWRPFFQRSYPRKRHSTGTVKDVQSLRTITASETGRASLVLAPSVEPRETSEDQDDEAGALQDLTTAMPTNRHRIRRSLSSIHRASRRRYFTDPTVQVHGESVNGTISPAVKQSPLSPMSNISTFDVELPHGSPAFNSSPPFIPVKHRFSFRKRESTAPSDPTTISSDNDTRVFTDDESFEFQSDTAFDSLATRATASSHSAMQVPKLDTIFTDARTPQADGPDAALEEMMQKTSLNESSLSSFTEEQQHDCNYGIGITGLRDSDRYREMCNEEAATLTPVKSLSAGTDDLLATPVPIKNGRTSIPFLPSAGSMQDYQHAGSANRESLLFDKCDFDVDEDDIEWSPKSESRISGRLPESQGREPHFLADMSTSPASPFDENLVPCNPIPSDKRMSIFDWSENQRHSVDHTNGGDPRPKTVHGKQMPADSRSRSSGRKGPSQMHLRSQSVPNNRDSQLEPTPLSVAKFGTWGLGHKPVSEEWSDDFEFDDVAEEENPGEASPQMMSNISEPGHRDSMRGVKVPQSIIDRQASVHVQFGQVQEFMLLVEELKRLRLRGVALDLVENYSKQLWEDADSIINLATINDEDEGVDLVRPRSPSASDVFGDEISLASRNGRGSAWNEEHRRQPHSQRTVSSPATPPYGRPRGESLAQAKSFLQNIHQSRTGNESSPLALEDQPQRKLPFDTQDLKDLVVRSGVITRALKEIVRKAEGVSVSPSKTPPRMRDPDFSQIFNAPDISPCPPYRKPGLPKSKSANSYLSSVFDGESSGTTDVTASLTLTAMV